MISLTQVGQAIVATGVIGGGALTLDHLHVASDDFEKHLAYQESRYVLELKKDVRELRKILSENDDEYLEGALADLIDELCELRPEDRECKD